VLPLLIVFSITSVETVGDVTATEELSRLDADGEHHNRRIKGGMLNGEWFAFDLCQLMG
jgi:xanthine/uracil permease